MPCAKVTYPDEKAAKQAVRHARRFTELKHTSRRSLRSFNQLRPYYCKWCAGWHLSTHNS